MTDPTLRDELASSSGASMIGTAGSGTVQDKIDTVPAQAKNTIENALLALDDATDEYTLGQIINRIGLTPQMIPGFTANASNHSIYINQAIDRVITAGGGMVLISGLTEWKIGSQIVCHKSGYQSSHLLLRGGGEKSIMNWQNTTGNMIVIGNGSNPVYDVTLENFYLGQFSSARTAGSIVVMKKASLCKLRNIIARDIWDGVLCQDVNSILIEDCMFIAPSTGTVTGTGITFYSDPNDPNARCDNVDVIRCTVQYLERGGSGLSIQGRVHTGNYDRVGLLGVVRGIQSGSAGNGAANIPTFHRFRVVEVDRASECSAVLDKGHRFEFEACDFSNTTGVGTINADTHAVVIQSGMDSVKFRGGRAGLCRQYGIYINGTNTVIEGMDISEFGRQERNVY
ncbi:MAG TPA: hypothetical protein VGE05_03840, partial [Novosphingobium sp.]